MFLLQIVFVVGLRNQVNCLSDVGASCQNVQQKFSFCGSRELFDASWTPLV